MHIKDVYHGRIKGSVTCIVLCSIPKPEGLVDVNCAGYTQFVKEIKLILGYADLQNVQCQFALL